MLLRIGTDDPTFGPVEELAKLAAEEKLPELPPETWPVAGAPGALPWGGVPITFEAWTVPDDSVARVDPGPDVNWIVPLPEICVGVDG